MATALLFPGQGAQVVGMAADLTQRSEDAAKLFAQASELLGFDLLELCKQGPAEELNRTDRCQPALFVHSYAALTVLQSEEPSLWDDVKAVAGLSLGEYTAVAAAGGLSFEDGVKLVYARGKAMQAAADRCESGMSSIIGLDRDKLAAVCEQASEGDDDFVQLANLLCPGNIAISGHIPAIARAEQQSTEAGAMKAIRLSVAGAFHTEIMRPAVADLEKALSKASFTDTKVPVISNVDAQAHTAAQEIQDQVVSPVLWEDCLRHLIDQDVDQFVEIGTGRVLAGTLKRINRKIPCRNYGE